MKKPLLTFLLSVLITFGLNARTFVLITGVSNYDNENANLTQTTKDAKRFKEVMETQTKDITLLTSRNVTRANVLEKLSAICNRAEEGDQVIFFYSGHGTTGALCGYDRNITYKSLTDILSQSKASQKICFIDACHAGSVADNEVNESWTDEVKDKKDMAFFVSCRGDETSAESAFIGAGYFTQALLKGLRGKSDKNEDRKVTVIELFKYIYGDVLQRTDKRQHPQLIAPESMYDVVITKW